MVPSAQDMAVLDELILGVKAKEDMSEIVRRFCIVADSVVSQKADYFLLACTEIPIIVQAHPFPHPFVDATAELAFAAVRSCGYNVKERG